MQASTHSAPLEIWGGIECTINRVGDQYFDQLAWSGHYDRIDDLDRIAQLGIRTLRYPVLWEHVAPDGPDSADWRSVDRRLERLRALGIKPIVTLVHHGSGPRSTSLLDPGFAEGLETFAGAVARRYPWIEDYTPVNEPLTTARFSALYGHWYPHKRDIASFLRSLVNEIAATSRAMAAIRSVNPNARLIQTEDIGKTHSTPLLQYQADTENERRWLSLDLLHGRVGPAHPFWGALLSHGIEEDELMGFVEEPCRPDLIGVNYYVTSERFLDERLEQYPAEHHGGNGIHTYADVEAVRAMAAEIGGFEGAVRETAGRFGRPIAMTEVHLGATRCEQLRWLAEAWDSAHRVRMDGVDLRALTVWALLGSYNWHRLVTHDAGHYESGPFRVHDWAISPTALAQMVREITSGREYEHPVLASPGWWRRPDRVLYGEHAVDPVLPATGAISAVAVLSSAQGPSAMVERRLRERGMAAVSRPLEQPDGIVDGSDGVEPWAMLVIAPAITGVDWDRIDGLMQRHAQMHVGVITRTTAHLDRPDLLVVTYGPALGECLLNSDDTFSEWCSLQVLDDLIDMLIDRSTGHWLVTHDGVLRPSTVAAIQRQAHIGPAGSAPATSVHNHISTR